jgi:hypothetical protein
MQETKNGRSDTPSSTPLSNFLRKLADEVDQKTLSPEEVTDVTEFYISYLYKQFEANENIGESTRESLGENIETETEDEMEEDCDNELTLENFRKFIFMGWFVYQNLITRN